MGITGQGRLQLLHCFRFAASGGIDQPEVEMSVAVRCIERQRRSKRAFGAETITPPLVNVTQIIERGEIRLAIHGFVELGLCIVEASGIKVEFAQHIMGGEIEGSYRDGDAELLFGTIQSARFGVNRPEV